MYNDNISFEIFKRNLFFDFKFVFGFFKIRFGKIMRRILRKVVVNKFDEFGDIFIFFDLLVVDVIVEKYEEVYGKK